MAVATVSKNNRDDSEEEHNKEGNRGSHRNWFRTSNVGIDNRSRYNKNKNNNNLRQLQMMTMAAKMKTMDRRDAYYGSNDNKDDL